MRFTLSVLLSCLIALSSLHSTLALSSAEAGKHDWTIERIGVPRVNSLPNHAPFLKSSIFSPYYTPLSNSSGSVSTGSGRPGSYNSAAQYLTPRFHRILNPKTARSQILGGVVWGLGMALEEETAIDQKLGRFINHNLAEYHVPSQADVADLRADWIDEHDPHVNAMGTKGIGEIGIVGTAAAIVNAAWHATGVRVRDLPVTLDALL